MNLPLDTVLLGESPVMVRLRRDIARLAPTAIPVLIEGETGTGKELVANALQTLSGRRGAFVPVNVSTIPDGLFESQVFGHRRGAFSGAVVDQRGYFEEADGGTLFLDEVASAPLHWQPKLLRVLETKRFRSLGARNEGAADVRVVAAANVSLSAQVKARRFREDLYYRLCGDRLVVPALRERLEDIECLLEHYVRLASETLAASVRIAPQVAEALRTYSWPGNVRQLRTVVERAVIGVEGDTLTADDVRHVMARIAPIWSESVARPGEARELFAILERLRWDTGQVAQDLGVSRKTIYARIQRLGLAIPGKFHRRRAGVAVECVGCDAEVEEFDAGSRSVSSALVARESFVEQAYAAMPDRLQGIG